MRVWIVRDLEAKMKQFRQMINYHNKIKTLLSTTITQNLLSKLLHLLLILNS